MTERETPAAAPLPSLPSPGEGIEGFWRSLEAQPSAGAAHDLRFGPGAAEQLWQDPVARRSFLKLMGASLALAGAAGCARAPMETIVPYVQAPEELVPGKPLYFATAMPRPGGAIGLLAKSHLGRPINVQGNPEHPASLGALDAIAQASILSLYDPDRSQTVRRGGAIDTWDRFLAVLRPQMERHGAAQGRGLCILTEPIRSPTLALQLARLLEKLPQAIWRCYEPQHNDNELRGAQLAYGRAVETVYGFDKADVVVSLNSDFLADSAGSVRYARDFFRRRRGTAVASMSRLFVAETSPTITGASADHRLPVDPRQLGACLQALAARLQIGGVGPPDSARLGETAEQWLRAAASDLDRHRGRSIVLVGRQEAPQWHALAHAINGALGNAGRTVLAIEPTAAAPAEAPQGCLPGLVDLTEQMRAGEIETLVILGGNPVYNAPGELEFSQALERVSLRIHLSETFDETSRRCHWHLPQSHYLECWSDTTAFDGTAAIQQPLIAPLYFSKSVHEVVAALDGQTDASGYELVQSTWRERLGEDAFSYRWRKALHDGVIENTASEPLSLEANEVSGDLDLEAPENDADSRTTVELRFDPFRGDGRHAGNPWLLELPDPLTKLTWDNVALLSEATARRLGAATGDELRISIADRSLLAPAWVMPGQPDDVVSLSLGLGRQHAGSAGSGVGYNAYRLAPASGESTFPAEVNKTGRRRSLAATQAHHDMHGRDIVRVATWDRARQQSQQTAQEHRPPTFYNLTEEEGEQQPNAWGMVIDQTACIGCNACVVACQAENNIPVVGKEQVLKGREMHWLRIDRYYHGPAAAPETYFQPMMCVHCELAPCEVVCPVAATVHDAEGTNNMVYNRCVGTRYCSNNCPYKVRRFNFLAYSDLLPIYSQGESPAGLPESLKLLHNPDVTVRTRGVMEKCTYCIQRINHARIAAKKENRPIADGEVQTACQQACPTRAITFGNLKDDQSQVARLKTSPLNYGVLAELNTRPRTTHLPRIVNAHPDLPPPSASRTADADAGGSHSGSSGGHSTLSSQARGNPS